MDNQKLMNEVISLNLMNASKILNTKGLWNQPKSPMVFKQIFENVVNYKPGINFNESQIFAEDSSFFKLMESTNIDAILASPTVQEHIIPFKNNNIYAYLSNLNEMMNPTTAGIVKFFESEKTSPITIALEQIRLILAKLSKSNDIVNITNRIALNTRIAMNNINVYGFNVFDVTNNIELQNIQTQALLFSNNTNQILIVTDNVVYSYDIKTDTISEFLFDYYKGVPVRFVPKDIKSSEQLFTELKTILNTDFTVLYINNERYKTDGTFNNLYNDQKLQTIIDNQKEKPNNAKNSKKLGVVRGYLVK